MLNSNRCFLRGGEVELICISRRVQNVCDSLCLGNRNVLLCSRSFIGLEWNQGFWHPEEDCCFDCKCQLEDMLGMNQGMRIRFTLFFCSIVFVMETNVK